MMKLTSAAKKRITRDWQACFPELGQYKPMWIMRRAGCLIIGIALERDSSNTRYRPTFHTHVLGKDFPGLSLTLAQRLTSERTQASEAIAVAHHAKHIPEACERLRRQASIALEGRVNWSEIERAYREQIKKLHFPIELYEDLILIAAWWAPEKPGREYYDSIVAEIERWPASIFAELGGLARWRRKFDELVSDRSVLEKRVAEEVQHLQLDVIPTFSVEWDGERVWG